MSIYKIPESIEDLFEQGENSYSIIDYSPEMEMDNNESMAFFLEQIGVQKENIILDNGTQVILKCNGYKEIYCIDSGGLGDFFSHGFDVSESVE